MSGQGYDDNTLTPARGGGGMRPSQHQHQPYQSQRGFHPQDSQSFHPQDLRAPDLDGYGMMSRSNASLNNSRGISTNGIIFFNQQDWSKMYSILAANFCISGSFLNNFCILGCVWVTALTFS